MVPTVYDLLRLHCTRGATPAALAANQARFLEGVAALLSSSRLRRRTPNELWTAAWDKPFYAHARAGVVGPYVARARETGLFDDPDWVRTDAFLSAADQPGPAVQREIDAGRLGGVCKAVHRLHRVQSLARSIEPVTDAVNAFVDAWERATLSRAALQERAVVIAEGIASGSDTIPKIDGFGFTTACHLLADLGLPLYKPDIWVCRIVSLLPGVAEEMERAWRLDAAPSLDWLESRLMGNRASDAYRRIVQPVMNALLDDAGDFAPAGLDLDTAFQRLRLVDWTVVHFAISAEPEIFGVDVRPVDLLRQDRSVIVPAHLRAFARLLHAERELAEKVEALARTRKKASRPEQSPAARRLAQAELERQLASESERAAARAAAQRAREAYRFAVTAQGWHLAPAFPAGFARKESASRWRYIRQAANDRAAANRATDDLLPA